jgi:predicted phage terminase large subunit-like protein
MLPLSFYFLSFRRVRGTPQTNEQIIRKTAEMSGIEVEIFMEQEPGAAGKSDIDHYARDILRGFTFHKGVRNTGSKVIRAGPLSGAAEHGNVKLVKADWNQAFLDELAVFPKGAHDDQVDAASGVFLKLNESPPLGGGGVTRFWR